MKKKMNTTYVTHKHTNRICTKGNHRKRHLQKSEVRYRIIENTMRGYFNYSI